MAAILECDNVTKVYGGLVAVKNVSFNVEEGQIFAIVGPNGAGKTTLFDTLSGLSAATEGLIRFAGRQIEKLRGDQICKLGLARAFQTTVSFATQTTLTNVLVGGCFGHGQSNLLGFPSAAVERALDALELCNLLERQDTLASQLSAFELKRLMLATALATRPTLLLLDEPVGGLNVREREQLMELMRTINRGGISILMIEHVMKAVQALADWMLVLHHGEKITEGAPATVLRDERVLEVYLGSATAQGDLAELEETC
jgi:branched-chain amino acid transport system ATP-binding protein